jgi:hypothetical protein
MPRSKGFIYLQKWKTVREMKIGFIRPTIDRCAQERKMSFAGIRMNGIDENA